MTNSIRINVDSWSAWQESVQLAAALPDEISHEPIKLAQVAPMKRRRMSRLSKIALEAAFNCLDSQPPADRSLLTLFVSQHGELTRTEKIVTDLVNCEDISPTDFGLSVHNSSSGLYSLNSDNTQASCSMAAGGDSFSFGLIEAANLLSRFPEKKVLMVCFDEALPDALEFFDEGKKFAYSVALLLSNKSQANYQLSMNTLLTNEQSEWPLALEFVQFDLSDKKSIALNGARYQWNFQKLC